MSHKNDHETSAKKNGPTIRKPSVAMSPDRNKSDKSTIQDSASNPEDRKYQPEHEKRSYLRYLSLGFELAASLAVPIYIGYQIDQNTSGAPWFTLSGIVLGMILFFYTIFKTVRAVDQEKT